MRDDNWVCRKCVLSQLPFFSLNSKEFDLTVPYDKLSATLHSPDELNSLFADSDKYPTETDDHIDQEMYMYTDDVHELTYNVTKGHPNIDFPILSLRP